MTSGTPQVRNGRVVVGEVPAESLAAEFATPLYALDVRVVDAQLELMRRALAGLRASIYYSCKANPSLAVLRRLRAAGVGLDACSPGDLAFARAAGFDATEISFTGHAVSDGELRAVADSGAAFVADSLTQVARIGELSPGREIGLRVNCGIEAGFHAHVQAGAFESKFGIHRSQVAEAREIAARHDLHIAGLHAHLGSDIDDVRPHLELLDALLDVGADVPNLSWINLGGGWASHDEGYDFASFAREAQRRLAGRLELRVEPGGFLVLDAGCLLTRVTDLKPAVAAAAGTTPSFVGVDTSHNHLVSAVIYGSQHPIWIADRPLAEPDGRFHVVGNLMQGGDVLARDRPLPEPRLGDLLVIGRCGGYAAWRAPAFNERPRPAEVVVDGAEVSLARRRETEDDLLRLEVM